MKSIFPVPFVLSLVLSGGMANAAMVEIKQNVYPLFDVTALGIEGLEELTIAAGSYEIESHAGFPVNTIISLEPISDGMHQYTAGHISWHREKNAKYTFIIAVSGDVGDNQKLDKYCIDVHVNSASVGKSCTSKAGYWNPTIVHNKPFSNNSKIVITLDTD